jgi:hypothetical protein
VRLNVLRGTLLPRPHAVHDYLYSERTRQSNKPTHARADGRENVEADVGLREGEGDERRLGFSISKLTQTRCAWVWCSVQARTRKVKVKFETKNSRTHTHGAGKRTFEKFNFSQPASSRARRRSARNQYLLLSPRRLFFLGRVTGAGRPPPPPPPLDTRLERRKRVFAPKTVQFFFIWQ